jgi:hypothetical protein
MIKNKKKVLDAIARLLELLFLRISVGITLKDAFSETCKVRAYKSL